MILEGVLYILIFCTPTSIEFCCYVPKHLNLKPCSNGNRPEGDGGGKGVINVGTGTALVGRDIHVIFGMGFGEWGASLMFYYNICVPTLLSTDVTFNG